MGYYVDFRIKLGVMTRDFEIPESERKMHSKSDIERKLSQWSDLAPNNLGTSRRYAFAEHFKPLGLLDKFLRKVEDGNSIDMMQLLSELLMQETIAGIITAIEMKGIKTHL